MPMGDIQGMNIQGGGPRGLTYIMDIQRMSTAKPPRFETWLAGVRCSVYSAIFTKKVDEPVGPFAKESWVCAVKLQPGYTPRNGDQLMNVTNVTTGLLRWKRLSVAFVQPVSSNDWHLWLTESV